MCTLLWGAATDAGRLPRYGGNVRVELAALPTDLDPKRLSGEDGHQISSCVYECLVRFGPSGVVEPGLAERWVRSEDARRWVFRLRTNVQFHDGTTCDAKAVHRSLHRLADPRQSNFTWILENLEGWRDFAQGRTPEIEGVLVAGTHEIELQFQEPVTDLLARLALPEAGIVHWSGTRPVGTGPFRAVSASPGALRLVAFEAYHAGRPFFDGLDLVINADADLTPWAKDATMRRVIGTASSSANATVVRVPAQRLGFAVIHPASAVLHSERARRRIAEGFDRSVFVQATLAGDGEPASGLVPGDAGTLASDAAEREGDLLQRPQESIRIVVPKPEPVLRRLGERLQVLLFASGFESVLDELQPDAFEVALLADRYDIVLLGWTAPQPADDPLHEATRVRYFLASVLEPAMRDQLPNSWANMWRGDEPATAQGLLAESFLIPLVFFHDSWETSPNMARVRPGRAAPALGLEAAHLTPAR